MVFFIKATPAPRVRRSRDLLLMRGMAVIIIFLAVAQLFTFEHFTDLLSVSYGIPNGTAFVMSGLIVILEVAAIPVLLGMTLSSAARLLGVIAGWMVTTGWVVMVSWTFMRSESDTGLLGATIAVPASIGILTFSLFCLVLYGYISKLLWDAVKNVVGPLPKRPLRRMM